MNIVKGVPNFNIKCHGKVLRGDENTSEDQIATCYITEEANRLAVCWNLLEGYSTYEIESGMVEVCKVRDNETINVERFHGKEG